MKVKFPVRNFRSGEAGARDFIINKTPLGFVYGFFFKHNIYLRMFTIYVWKRVFPVGVILFYPVLKVVRRLPLMSLAVSAVKIDSVRGKEWVFSPRPQFFSVDINDVIPCCALGGYDFPSTYIAKFDSCKVLGGSNFFFSTDSVVCHDLFKAETDYTNEEAFGRMVIRPSNGLVYYFESASDSGAVKVISEASVFTDALSGNYAHFITEVLPRIHEFVKHGVSSIPLVIDAGLHANMYMAIRLIVGEGRELIELEVGESLQVSNLHVMSNCGYIPYERRPGTCGRDGHSDGIFSPGALVGMRDSLRGLIPVSGAPIKKKIFVKRNSKYRNVINSAEVESLLLGCGFEVVEPEKLDFCEQVSVFSNADIIVGATGAAFANLIFCKESAQIVIMISRHESMPYYYWQNMASAVGCSVSYVLGDIKNASVSDIHGDFTVSLDSVRDALGV